MSESEMDEFKRNLSDEKKAACESSQKLENSQDNMEKCEGGTKSKSTASEQSTSKNCEEEVGSQSTTPKRSTSEKCEEVVRSESPTQEQSMSKQSLPTLSLPSMSPTNGGLSFIVHEVSYDDIFRQELPLETSSMKSDSSTLSDKSESPRKSPRKPRIAAKFTVPMDLGSPGQC
jgi:hypothetical protein